MSAGATFDRVYDALRRKLVAGAYPPGHRLEPAVLGEELFASLTPVRDALHRLVGERLVVAPRTDGFQVPMLTELVLRDLYGWNERLLVAALGSGRGPATAVPPAAGQDDATALAARLFLAIAACGCNREHKAAMASLNDRLSPIREAERQVIGTTGEELERLRHSFAAADIPALRRGLGAYHRRRQKLTPEILAARNSGIDL